MQITTSAGVTCVELDERIDASSAESVEKQLLAIVGDQPVRLLLDCSKLDYISSIGLRIFVVLAKRMAAVKGKYAFCAMSEKIRRVFSLVGFDSTVAIHPSREEALAALGKA